MCQAFGRLQGSDGQLQWERKVSDRLPGLPGTFRCSPSDAEVRDPGSACEGAVYGGPREGEISERELGGPGVQVRKGQ